jgi:hypothetical protein
VQWYPYGAFGLPADYQQVISLSPMNYLAGAIGALLRVRDALLLFKLSVIAEQMVFALGTWLLARNLFASRATAIALGLAAGGTVVWYAQQWFELRFFYLLPLLLFFFRSFLDAKRAEFLWLAGLTAVAWTLGNVPYFVPIWVMVLAIVCAVPAIAYGRAWTRLLAPRASNWLLLGAFLASAGSSAYLALHSVYYLVSRDQGRSPTGGVDLEAFRSHGGNAVLDVVARSVTTGWPQQLPWGAGADNSFYFGLLPLVGVAIAIVARERSATFVGLVASAAVLVMLSLGGIVATIAFYLPGMALYRHVGLVYGLVKALLIAASGFGLERLWRWRPLVHSRQRRWIAMAALTIAIVGIGRLAAGIGGSEWAAAWPEQVLLRVLFYVALGLASLALTRSLKVGLLLALALDLGIFQTALYTLRAPQLSPAYAAKLGAFDVAALRYQPERLPQPSPSTIQDPRPKQVLDLAQHPASMEVYWVTYQMAGFDPCRSVFWNELATYGVNNLMRFEGNRLKDFDEIIGCRAPKLRLVAGPTVVGDRRAAQDAFLDAAKSSAPVRDVIRLNAGAIPPPVGAVESPHAGAIDVTHFTPNELTVKVEIPHDPGAWLLYADAMLPGWNAKVDGQLAPIGEANLAFKAVWVPAGAHEVQFWFERGLSYHASHGVALFGLAWALGFVALVFVDPTRSNDR